jgi:hypothetical protein
MKKLAQTDIRGPRLYEAIRDDLRKAVIAVKKRRRVSVGPVVTLVFENRQTLIFQIEEMCRAEKLEDRAKIQAEIDVYNDILPGPGELSATLFVEIVEESQIRDTLNQLVGIDEHVFLKIGQLPPVHAVFEPGRSREDKISSVQYIRFPLTEAHRGALAAGPASLAIDHPGYRHETPLSDDTRAELARDLE